MEIRKLVKSGPGSMVVTVPKGWLDKHQLKRGDLLYVQEDSGGQLVVSPTMRKAQQKRGACTIDSAEHPGIIRRKVVSAYIDNCDTITISGDTLSPEEVSAIRNQVEELAGLEVVMHTPKQILIKDMLNVDEISIKDTVRKMDVVLRLMFEDLQRAFQNQNVTAAVWERDDRELNKLYFLTFRLIKLALEDRAMQQREELDNFHLISHLRLIVIMEDIGDQIKYICAALEQVPNRKIPELVKIAQALEQDYRDMVTAYFKRDRDAAYQFYLARRNVRDMCDAYFKKNRSIAIAAVLQKLKNASKLTEDISKIIRYL